MEVADDEDLGVEFVVGCAGDVEELFGLGFGAAAKSLCDIGCYGYGGAFCLIV